MESEVQVIKSTTVARRVVDSLGLSTLAEFNPALAPSEDNIADDIKTAIKGLFKPVIAWLREGTVERRGIELARSEEHTSELQSLMRSSYAVFCLKKKNKHKT